MAIDQTSSPSPAEASAPAAIENEFPTYRAISSLAVFSLVFGLASVFCFADLWFLLLVGASTISGWLALRKIRKFPDILTGAAFARAGIGFGLLFGMAAVTHEVVQHLMIVNDAGRFAKHYIEIIKDKPVSNALWYEQDLEYRQHKSPEDVVAELKKAKNPMTPDAYGAKAAPFNTIKDRLKVAGQEFRFVAIEDKAVMGLTVFANALLELDGPVTEKYPTKEYALIMMSKAPGRGAYDWVVSELKFPYKPASVALAIPAAAADDGHGHAPGSH